MIPNIFSTLSLSLSLPLSFSLTSFLSFFSLSRSSGGGKANSYQYDRGIQNKVKATKRLIWWYFIARVDAEESRRWTKTGRSCHIVKIRFFEKIIIVSPNKFKWCIRDNKPVTTFITLGLALFLLYGWYRSEKVFVAGCSSGFFSFFLSVFLFLICRVYHRPDDISSFNSKT